MAEIEKTAEEIVAEQAAAANAEAAKILEPLAKKDEEIAKLKEDVQNYKNVALKRLGKLPGDAEFLEGADKETGLTVAEQVRTALLEREISEAEKAKDALIKDQVKTISELKLAFKNKPHASLGGGSGESLEIKDNVLTDQQIAVLRAKGERHKLSGEKLDAFVEKAKQNLLKNR